MQVPLFFKTIVLLSVIVLSLGRKNNEPDAILLSEVNQLNFFRGRKTTGRRSSGVPQLNCVSGNACGSFEPDIISCQNIGIDGNTNDVAWKCEASLPSHVRLGTTDVTCEGYDSSYDEYVLRGSCGLEYTLHSTGTNKNNGYNRGNSDYQYNYQRSSSSTSSLRTVAGWGVLAVLAYVVYDTFFKPNTNNHPRPPSSGNSGSGGGNGGSGYGGGGDGSGRHFPGSGGNSCDGSYSSNTTYPNNNYNNNNNNNGWGGFMTGMGLASLAGMMFGGGRRRGYGGYNNYGYGAYNNGGWGTGGGWGGGGYRRTGGWGGGGGTTSRASSSRGASSMASSSSYGGTRRR